MALKTNIEYWELSLKNPEPIIDEYYIYDEIIVDNEELIQKVKRLRELIIAFCVMLEKDNKAAETILDETYEIIINSEKIQYTEFIAFWKTVDMSFSIFENIPNQKEVLKELLRSYCLRRRRLYDELGYTNTTVQALYDSGASRRKGTAGIEKVLRIVTEVLGLKEDKRLTMLEKVKTSNVGYFLPDQSRKNKRLFHLFCKEFEVSYQFGREHQGKMPDIVLKIGEHFFIIEAKHIKESGGAQDKQVVELIEFIRHTEKLKFVHYLSFMDGLYFNKFIKIQEEDREAEKVKRQKKDIEDILKNNPKNFFVNTAGLKEILRDLSEDK